MLYKKTKWLEFVINERKPKTLGLAVMNTNGDCLGNISWHSPWRQYTFNLSAMHTRDDMLIFNNQCLQDIADVLTSLNKEHKEKQKSNA